MKFSLIVLGLLVVGYTHWLWPGRLAAQAREDSQAAERHRMVEEQIKARGIKDEGLLAALLKVPRERFVPSGVAPQAHADRPLPIGYGQTISQPYVVAYMTEGLQLTKNKRVLEIGTGSGYQAALLGDLAREVYTIEIVPQLADQARTTLAALGYRNVHVRTGDGYLGWPEQAPFDAIIYGPPRAFLSVSGSYVLLTQHGTPGDSNSAIVLIPTRTFHPVRTPHLGRRGEAWRPVPTQSYRLRLRWETRRETGTQTRTELLILVPNQREHLGTALPRPSRATERRRGGERAPELYLIGTIRCS